MKEIEELGPVDYLILEFPGNKMTGEGIPLLLDLVDRGIVRILDLAFIRKDLDGTITAVKVEDMDSMGAKDFEVFVGASSGLLGQEEFQEAAEVIEPGNSAGILIYENTWAAPLAIAWRKGGAQMIATGRISVQALIAAAESGTGVGT
ncbi:DUF6325 family protein [Catellatospora sp. TT07R-123]|uniref:DUF6325 family protein n=1 Tax=Catellatospora sp. TT07R-123 TaxID=2733863 RepID=UPI001BB38124|nr:DUF6325 family protein [Catellatospora sp. TT07R-123]